MTAERENGSSKVTGSVVWEALRRVTVWGLRRRVEQLRGRFVLAGHRPGERVSSGTAR